MNNVELAREVIRKCRDFGVEEFILCAGARNAPLVKALSESDAHKVFSFFEERSAAFFAIGRMLDSRSPVAVVTTSGTAAAELLPACIEADYQGLPLVLITADRPRRFRGSGAPQAIIQPGIFSEYVAKSIDVEKAWDGDWDKTVRRPIHINVCFDEPLVESWS